MEAVLVVMQDLGDTLGPHNLNRSDSPVILGVHNFIVDENGQRLNSVRHVYLVRWEPVTIGISQMLAALFEGIATLVFDARASGVGELEAVVA